MFRFKDGHPLTRQLIEEVAVIEALQKVGIDQSRYGGHSYRTGAAMTAAKGNVPLNVTNTLGLYPALCHMANDCTVLVAFASLKLAQKANQMEM